MEQKRNKYLDAMSEKFLDAYDDLHDIGDSPTPDQREDYDGSLTKLTASAVELLKLNVPHKYDSEHDKVTLEVSGKEYTVDAGNIRGILGEDQFDEIFGIEKPKETPKPKTYDADTMKKLLASSNLDFSPDSVKSIQEIMDQNPLLGSMAAMNMVMFATASEEAKQRDAEARDDDTSGKLLSDLADVRTRVRHFVREKQRVDAELEETKKALAAAQEKLSTVKEGGLDKEAAEKLARDMEAQKAEIEKLTAENKQLSGKIASITTDRDESKAAADKLRISNAALNDRIKQMSTEADKTKAGFGDKEKELSDTRAAYESLKQSMQAMRSDYNKQLKEAAEKYDALDKQMSGMKGDYEKQLNSAKGNLQKQRQLQNDLNAMKKENDKLREDLAKAEQRSTEIQSQVDSLAKTNEKLRDAAYNDPKTGTLTNAALARDLSANTPDNAVLAVIGIHGTKDINEKYGRATGDRMLKAAAGYVQKEFPECRVYRWLGDRFMLMFPNCSADTKNGLTDRLNDLTHTMEDDGISMSYGIADGSRFKDWNKMIEAGENTMIEAGKAMKSRESERVPEKTEDVVKSGPDEEKAQNAPSGVDDKQKTADEIIEGYLNNDFLDL